MGRRLVTLRLSDDETHRLADLAGKMVELAAVTDLDIAADGSARVTMTHDILNLTTTPLTRFMRELWFLHTSGGLDISPLLRDERKVMIQRTHDSPNMSKFGCQLSPPLEPGDVARIGYTCEGARFVDDLYWRMATPRYTRHLTIRIRHEGAKLRQCSAVEELIDGSEVFATDDILWDQDDDGATMTLTRDYLSPGQAVTLRWEI